MFHLAVHFQVVGIRRQMLNAHTYNDWSEDFWYELHSVISQYVHSDTVKNEEITDEYRSKAYLCYCSDKNGLVGFL